MATNKQTQIDYIRGPSGASGVHGIMAHCKYRRRPESEQETRKRRRYEITKNPEKEKSK